MPLLANRRLVVLVALVALAAVAAALPPAASADQAWTYTGSTLSPAPTFDRPNGVGPSQLGQQVAYHEQRIQVTAAADCEVIGSQDYDGYLHVYQGFWDASDPINPAPIAGNDDGPLGLVGESRVQFTGGFGTYIIVTSGFVGASRGSFQNHVHCEDDLGAEVLFGECSFYVSGVPVENQVCLDEGFAVAIDGVSNSQMGGLAVPVRMSSKNSAFFWFYNDRNFEVVVKVLNACSFPAAHPQRGFWVFAAALSNQAFRVKVRAPNGAQRTVYTNPLGNPATALTSAPEFDESFCP
jgi:hypothetical protein